ncbi:type II secretion system protein, partial [bacterium]|nr:type II secretion system protein [bacterium]
NELRETPHIGKDIERYPSKGCSQAEGKSLLLERRCHEVTEDLQKGNKKLDFRTQEFENDSHHVILSNNCGGEKQTSSLGEGFCVNELNVEILRPSAEILSEQSTTNAQNDKQKFPPPLLLVCSRLTGLRARLSALTLRPQLASRFKKGGNIPAFTLAEVLVTLGIIGVVAAMTLPMLAENYQRIIVQTRLKKFYTTFNQAILRSVEINGPSDSWFYLVSDKNDSNGNKIHQVDTIASNFDYYLRPYLNVIQTQKIIYTDGTEN